MDHSGISIFYKPSDGCDWAQYVYEKLTSTEYNIPTELNEFTADSQFHTASSKANLFLISPDVLALPKSEWKLLKDFDRRSSMVILVGLDHADLVFASEKFQVSNILQWLTFEIEETEGSVRDMLICIISIYEGQYSGSPVRGSETYENYNVTDSIQAESKEADRIYFKLPCDNPRQVNRVCNVFYKDDEVFLLLEREAEGNLKVVWDDDVMRPTQLCGMTVYHIDKLSDQSTGRFTVTLDDTSIGTSEIEHDHLCDSSISEDEPDDEYIPMQGLPFKQTPLKVRTDSRVTPPLDSSRACPTSTPPHSKSPHIHPDSGNTVTTGGNKLDKIRELLESETDPKNTLCKCLGIENDSRQLDRKMTSMVEYTETLKHISISSKTHTPPEPSAAVWPTLLHFGAQYNLLSFCDALLSNNLMHGYCVTPNKNGDLPQHIARKAGHTKLADLLAKFASYVKLDKHDSGFSSEMPRLSNITLRDDIEELPPPHPHSDTSDSEGGYLQMDKKLIDGLYGNTQTGNNPPFPKRRLSTSKDGGLGHSFDDDAFDDPMLKTPTNMIRPQLHKDNSMDYPNEDYVDIGPGIAYDGDGTPFPDMLNLGTSPGYAESAARRAQPSLSKSTPRSNYTYTEQASMSPSRSTFSVCSPSSRTSSASSDGDGCPVIRHKNINSFMGIDSPMHPSHSAPQMTKTSRSGIKSMVKSMFSTTKKKTGRSYSEPTIAEVDVAAITARHKEPRVHRKTSLGGNQRLSDTSNSSSNSTYSESTMSTILDSPENESTSISTSIESRGKKEKKKNKKKIKIFKREARQSVRISHVMLDHNLTGPSLPRRDYQEQY